MAVPWSAVMREGEFGAVRQTRMGEIPVVTSLTTVNSVGLAGV